MTRERVPAWEASMRMRQAERRADKLKVKNAELLTALREIRHSLFVSDENVDAIDDTLWMASEVSPNETVLDYIDATLERHGITERVRPAEQLSIVYEEAPQ